MNKIPIIGIYMPTRGRAHQAVSTLNQWAQLSADPDNIRYLIGVDSDDEESQKIQPGYNLEIHIFNADTITNGARQKQMVDKLDVDIYLAINDYTPVLTQYWDNILRQLMALSGTEIAAIKHETVPNALHFTACSKKWMSLANQYEPQIFPFWFSDQWRIEMYCFVFGQAPNLYADMSIGGGTSPNTHNMRDLDIWWGLFHALRPRRLREAYEVYKGYGLSCPTFEEFLIIRRDMIDQFIRVDAGQRKKFHLYEQSKGDKGEPSERYLKAKANAERLIAEKGLELWQMKF